MTIAKQRNALVTTLAAATLGALANSAAAQEKVWHHGLINAKADAAIPDGQLTLGLRPEHLVVCKPEEGLKGKVDLVEELGDSTVVYSELPGSGQIVAAKLQGHMRSGIKAGDPIGVRPLPNTSNLFDGNGKAIYLK